ncbi:MAG: hypothetical protein KDC98_04495 [Planctomycetes bacterium]|nr:hypothetical protein [Planctomycetota bacterium]
MTRKLWGGDRPEARRVLAQHDIEASITIHGDPEVGDALLISADRLGAAVPPFASGFLEQHSIWRLRPRRGSEQAKALLMGDPDFVVESVCVAGMRECKNGDVVISEARLLIGGRIEPGASPVLVAEDLLPSGTLEAMQSWTAFELRNYIQENGGPPTLLGECESRLQRMAPAVWLPTSSGGGPRLSAFAWIDEGLASLDDRRVAELLGGEPDADATFDDRLARLKKLHLLACVTDGDRRQFYALRADRVWLWSCLRRNSTGLLTHESEWLAIPLPVAGVGPEPDDMLADGRMQFRFEVVRHAVPELDQTALRVVATPVAVALDLALGTLAFALFHGWFLFL